MLYELSYYVQYINLGVCLICSVLIQKLAADIETVAIMIAVFKSAQRSLRHVFITAYR